IKPAVMTVGGWFDAENLFGALETFKAAEANNPPSSNHLVMGPWVHGGWSGSGAGDHLGDARFNAKTAEFYREKIEFPFFEFHLKGKGDGKHPKAWVFETGTNRWRKFDSWPPKESRPEVYQFADRGTLAPVVLERRPGAVYDEFVSDPAKPVPFINK